MRPTYIWAAVVALACVLAAITLLLLTGHDPTPVIAFLTGIPATVVAAIAALRASAVSDKVDNTIVPTLGAVAKNVNGHLSRLADAAGIPRGEQA